MEKQITIKALQEAAKAKVELDLITKMRRNLMLHNPSRWNQKEQRNLYSPDIQVSIDSLAKCIQALRLKKEKADKEFKDACEIYMLSPDELLNM